MIDSGEIAHAETRDELLAAITSILDAGRAAGDLRSDVAVDGIAASVIGIFTVTTGQGKRTGRLLDLLVDGLRPQGRRGCPAEDLRALIDGQALQARCARTHCGRLQPGTEPRTTYALVSGIRIGGRRTVCKTVG